MCEFCASTKIFYLGVKSKYSFLVLGQNHNLHLLVFVLNTYMFLYYYLYTLICRLKFQTFKFRASIFFQYFSIFYRTPLFMCIYTYTILKATGKASIFKRYLNLKRANCNVSRTSNVAYAYCLDGRNFYLAEPSSICNV